MSERATFEDLFPPVEALRQLPPEEIALYILQYFARKDKALRGEQPPNRINFMNSVHASRLQEAEFEMAEGLHWLYMEGLIADKPRETGHWVFITRKGKQLLESADLSVHLYSSLLPIGRLDAVLERKVRPAFIRGDYDVAVLQAYREVEIRIRNFAGLGNEIYGHDLIVAAFQPERGCLTDNEQLANERESVFKIFDGAIGLFKNPLSHRDVNIDNPNEAAELVLFANYLLRFVERRKEILEEHIDP